MRALSLAFAQPRVVIPRAHYAPRPIDGILVLQRGENPSTDYYLRPRLQEAGVPAVIADLDEPPQSCALLGPGGAQALMLIVCRYATPAWLQALEAAKGRIARAAFFMDDDLPAMMKDPDLPPAARGKVALHFAAHVDRLSTLSSELWVSTQILARRYPEGRPRLITPLPEAEPPEPALETPRRAVYHGADVHRRERRFVLEVARRLAAAGCDLAFEIAGDEALRQEAAGLQNVRVIPQRPWPEYLANQAGVRAAVSLAPLFPSAVNDARAPVKAFDAARLGAAGLYADAPAYRTDVGDGVDGLILPMDAQAWAAAIAGLIADPARRLGLAASARRRLIQLLAAPRAFPPPAAA